MNPRDFRDEVRPWSFFLPVAAAVAAGVLVANAIGFATSAIVVKHSAAEQVSATSALEPVTAGPAQVSSAGTGTGAATASTAAAGPGLKAKTVVAPLPVLDPVRLPGPSSARRDGELRACINGSIALRVAHGWQQEVLNDAPAHCQANSP